MTNQEMAQLLNQFQVDGRFHPLTCSNDNKTLIAKEQDGKVVLACPKCGWVQDKISEIAMDLIRDWHAFGKAVDSLGL